MISRKPRPTFALAFALLALASAAQAQRPTNTPQLSSRSGAAYTLYLDFEGFDFTGAWGGDDLSKSKGYASYGNAVGSFDAARRSQIQTLWARVAEKYTAFDVNVTTLDPARAALGAGATDAQRQAYYDYAGRTQHTIVTATDAADNSTAGGVSFVGSAHGSWGTGANGGAGSGYNTNFVFAPANPIYDMDFAVKTMAESTAHENGHALGLDHQSDYYASGRVDDYSSNYETGGGWGVDQAPTGSFAPVMGFSTFHQRGLWREGRTQASGGKLQDDVAKIYAQDGMGGPVEDGVGNSFAGATELALGLGGKVDSARAKGVIVPTSTDPDPLGAYQGGYYRFQSGGGALTLRATNGSSFLQSGVADPGMTLENVLRIYDANRNLIATGLEDSLTRWSEFSGTLTAGTYYAVVASKGGVVSAQDPTARYYNMGSYFLSGSGFAQPVPEPATLAAFGLGVSAFVRRRRK